jgi:hypothetical protein
LTESLHLVLSSMSDGEIIRNGWWKIGTDKAWDAGYQSLARCLNNTHKLLVPALSDADESIASERGSAAGESSDEELSCTDLLERCKLSQLPENGVKTHGASSSGA